jgi:hypothetical protein
VYCSANFIHTKQEPNPNECFSGFPSVFVLLKPKDSKTKPKTGLDITVKAVGRFLE